MGTAPTWRWSGTCATTGKHRYKSRKDARAAARALGKGLQPYSCEGCDDWHIGHRGDLTREEHRQIHKIIKEQR